MTRFLRMAAVLSLLVAGLLAAAALWMGSRTPTEDFLEGSVWTAATLSLSVIGTFIALRRPRHVVGWLLLVAGIGNIAAGVATLYGQYGGDAGAPGAVAVAWLGGSLWSFSASALLVFLPLNFPTGRPPSPRWRWVGWTGVGGVVLILAGPIDIALFRPELMALPWERVEVLAADRLVFGLSGYGFALLLAAGPVALLALVVRFLRARGEERQQIKLLVFAAAVTVSFILAVNVVEVPPLLEAVGTAVALPSIGVATMVAVLRYRLFDIDRVISRTLAYAILTALLIGIYLAAVTTLTRLTAPVTRNSPVAVAAATLLAAAAFQPARRQIQTQVDRRFNRARYDGRRTVDAFATSLRQEVDIDDVRVHLVDTIGEVLQPTDVKVWLRPGVTAR